MRYTTISINHDPSDIEELLGIEQFETDETDVSKVLWDQFGWLDGIGKNDPVGVIVQMPEGYWTFPGEKQLRIYVQVG